jgi:hypothetical protein
LWVDEIEEDNGGNAGSVIKWHCRRFNTKLITSLEPGICKEMYDRQCLYVVKVYTNTVFVLEIELWHSCPIISLKND